MEQLVKLGTIAIDNTDNEVVTITKRARYEIYPKIAEKTILTEEEVKRVVKKLAKHFKLGNYTINFYGNCGARIWSRGYGGTITFPHKTTIALVCHELCHALCHKRYKKGIRHNTKKWVLQLNRLIRYCQNKNYWNDEIKRIREPKPQKPEPTKEELRLKRIQQLKERKEKYERRIRLSENKIKKLNRQISGVKRFI